MLELKEIRKRFGGLHVIDGVSLRLNEGEILSLIGPNGAGKTTLFNMIAGFFRPDGGEIRFKGKRIDHLRPFQVCRSGIGRTFQLVKPFGEATVLDNVMVGAFSRFSSVARAKQQAEEELEFVGLTSRKDELAHGLPIGDRKKLEIARTMATEPGLLLLDEPMGGLNPTEAEVLMEIIRAIRKKGKTIFLIEHVMSAVMKLSERIVVLNNGQIISEGPPLEVSKDKNVIAAYLGEEYSLA
jgi:branched-chain amino acid transport system ATP-binding protein